MSLPETFSIFSPSLFKSLSPQDYLSYLENRLETLPYWQKTAGIVTIISLATILISTALSIITEDQQKAGEEKSTITTFFNVSIALSTLTFATGAFFSLGIPFLIRPLIEGRVEWLQQALNS